MRHDVRACRESGEPCDGCRLRMLFAPNGTPDKVDAAPYRELLKLTVASGATISNVATRCGVSRTELTAIWYGRRHHIWHQTAQKLRDGLLSFIPEDA